MWLLWELQGIFYCKFCLLLSHMSLHANDVCMNMCSTACMHEDQMTTFISFSPLWVPRIKLRLSGLQGKGFCPLSHLSGTIVRYLKSRSLLKQSENNYQCISASEFNEE